MLKIEQKVVEVLMYLKMDYKNKDIILGKDAQKSIVNGINKLANAVKVTMGPSGKFGIITNEMGVPYSTKDGVSVAKYTKLQDPGENYGCMMAKEVSIKTGKEAGDGTTTALVLIQSLINHGIDFLNKGGSYNEIKDTYKILIPKVLKKLKKVSKPLSKRGISHVATVSANNDLEIGKLIGKAFNFSKHVMVEEGKDSKDIIEKIEGVRYPVTFLSKQFIINESKMVSKINNPVVLLLDCKLDDLDKIKEIILHCNETKKPLVIISELIADDELHLLEANHLNNALTVLPIKTPGFGSYRKEYIKDISLLTGATIIKNLYNQVHVSSLGHLKSIETGLTETIMLPESTGELTQHIINLSNLYNKGDLSEYDKDVLGERIKNLNAKVSIIKVGGTSELEMKERFDRVEDAVFAVSAALEEGTVIGGGITLYKIANSLEEEDVNNILVGALRSPNKTINENGANVNPKTFNNRNIKDPTKVTRVAVENATSVALTLLGTEVIVLNEHLWN